MVPVGFELISDLRTEDNVWDDWENSKKFGETSDTEPWEY